MAGGKKYGVYVGQGISMSDARRAVNKINNRVGAPVARIVKNKTRADAVLRTGSRDRAQGTGGYTYEGARDRLILNRKTVRQNEQTALGRKTTVRLAAHEIGHGLGLEHSDRPMNLLNPDSGGSALTKKQRRTVRQTYRRGGYS